MNDERTLPAVRRGTHPPRGRPRKGDEAQRHTAILAHALDEFVQHGFSGTTIDSIARRAQVSKMTIYKYFGDKEGLFRALGRQVSAPVRQRVAEVVTQDRPAPEVLCDFARALRYHLKDSVAFGLLRLAVFEQHRFPLIAAAIYQSGLDTLTPLVAYLAELIGTGVIHADDPDEAVVQFCALITRGHRFLLVEDDGGAGQDQYIARTVGLFLRGLRHEPAA